MIDAFADEGASIIDHLFRQIAENTGYYDREKLERLILAMSHAST